MSLTSHGQHIMQVERQNRAFYHRAMPWCPYLPRRPATQSMLRRSLLWCYSSSCITCQSWSDSSDLCRSASARKAEKSTMVHTQPVLRGHICYPSWWTPQGDDLVKSPGPLAGREWMGWSSSGGGAYHSWNWRPFLKASHVTRTLHAQSSNCKHVCTVYSSQECIWWVCGY